MERQRSRAWRQKESSGKSRGHAVPSLPMRRLRLEALEDRRLLSLVGVPPLGGLEWPKQPTDEPADAELPPEIALSGEAGILTAAPATPDLLAESDTGISSTDNLTNLDNSTPEKSLQFSVGNTIVGATVTLYADGMAIGSAVADSATTTVTTNGAFDLADGRRTITARQTAPGDLESPDSAALDVRIKTVPAVLGTYRGGYAIDVAVSGTRAYVTEWSAGLEIVDVSNPAAPVRLGRYDTSGSAEAVAISGTKAYVADNTAGLVILDVTNPAAPVQLGNYDTAGKALGVAISGTWAYVADDTAGLVIIDVTNPAAPALLGAVDTLGNAKDVAVSGTLAYVADYSGGLSIIDVTSPTAPRRLGGCDTSGIALSVAVSGTLAYVADFKGVAIIDVSNPAAPLRLARYDTPSYAYGVAVSGTLAFVADYDAGLQIIDVTHPAAPVLFGAFDTVGRALGVAAGTFVYVADGSGSLVIVSVGSPALTAAPDLESASDTGANNSDDITGDNTPTLDLAVPPGYYFRVYRDGIQISGDWESGATYTTGVQADGTYGYSCVILDAAGNAPGMSPAVSVSIDTTIPSAPDLLAVSDSGVSDTDNLTNLDNSMPSKALQFAVGNTVAGATVTLYADGVLVGSAVAAGTTTMVTTNGSMDFADGVHAIMARQTLAGHADCIDSAKTEVTVDTIPSLVNPAPLGSYDTMGSAYNVVIAGVNVYVASSGGLDIIDIANPSAPVRLGGRASVGTTRYVSVVGTLAYVAQGSLGLDIIDVSNPAAPARLGGYDTSGTALGVAVSGSLAYVADGTAGLTIIDVSNPARPFRVGNYNTVGSAYGVTIAGKLAYVADWDAGLQIIDVSNPAAPARLGGYDTNGNASGVALRGTRAYVADGSAGLQILDVTNPAAPTQLGRYLTNTSARGLTVAGTVVYTACDTGGLRIIDVSDPASPVQVGNYDTTGYADGVAVKGANAYVADGSGGLVILDLSRPASPPAPDLQAASDTGISNADDITGETALTLDVLVPPGAWFRIYRDGVPVSGDYETGSTFAATVPGSGSYAFAVAIVDAAGNTSALSPSISVTVDTLIPLAPDLLAVSDSGISNTDNLTNLDNNGPTKTLQFTVGDTTPGAMVTVYADGVAIGHNVADSSTTIVTTSGNLDIADGPHAITARQSLPGRPESPDSARLTVSVDTVANVVNTRLLGGYDTAGTAREVALSGTLAYVADGVAGLQIIDITNPTSPVRLGSYDTNGDATGVAVSGTVAYVADGSAGLQFIDVSNPAAPVRLGGYKTSGGWAYGVAVSGTLAYVVDVNTGFQIIDVTDPVGPVRLGAFDTAGSPRDVAVSGRLAYVADYTGGLVIIDVTNPAAPVRLGGCDTGGSAYDVAVSGPLAYVADATAGLVIIDVTNPLAPVRLGGYDTAGSALDVKVSGTIACVADGQAGIQIIDVASPVAPARVGGYDTIGSALGVAICGTLAYVADNTGGLVIIDVGPSALPLAPDLETASDTGISSVDNITSDSTPTFTLSVPPGSYFRVYRDGSQSTGDYETGTSYTAPAQANGTYYYAVAVVDATGNESALSPALAVTIDTAIPSAPDLLMISDTGISNTDDLTNLDNSGANKVLRFTVGNTVPGSTVTLYADSTVVGSTIADGVTTSVTTEGSFDLVDGTHTITARQTVPGRPESTDSAALKVTVDTATDAVNALLFENYDTSGNAETVAVSGKFAYVADSLAGLQIIDVSDPAAPVRLGGYDTSGFADDVAVVGRLAYVADDHAGLVILDVTNPAAPVRLGGLAGGLYAEKVVISGSLAYLANDGAGLDIVDVSDPVAPVWLGRYSNTRIYGVAVSGSLACITNIATGLHTVDVSNPAAPVPLGSLDTDGYAFNVTIAGTLAFVADGDAGLVIIDVSNPTAPVRLGGYDTFGSARDVAVAGTLAYVADIYGGLEIIDVSNPAAPATLGRFKTGGSATGVTVAEKLIYVAEQSAGLQAIDPTGSPDLQRASDTGISRSDNLTADATPTFSLAVRTGSYFRVYRDGVQISGDYEAGSSYTTAVQPDGTYDYTIAVVDAAGNVSPQSPPLRLTIDTTPPAVVEGVINGGAAQRSQISSLAIRFSEDVSGSLGATDLTLINRDSGAAVNVTGATPTYDPATQTATWNLSGIALVDGYYRATLQAAGISDVAGNLLGGSYLIDFFRLLGDTDGNASVDIFDVAKLQVNYGSTSGMSPAEGDFDGNGTVDIFDVAILQTQYGKTLTAPAPMPAAAAGAPGAGVESPLVARECGHSPGESGQIAASLGGRVSGPPEEPSQIRHGVSCHTGHLTRSVKSTGLDRRHVRRSGAHAAQRPMQPLAVRHALETASWASAVDGVLEKA